MSSKSTNCKEKDLYKEIYQLNAKIRVLDKGIESYLGNNRNFASQNMHELLKESRDHYRGRQLQIDKWKIRIIEIKRKTNKFQQMVANIEANETFVKNVKDIMEEIESLITQTKIEQKEDYEQLLKSEINLWEESVAMERRITYWDSGENNDELENMNLPIPQISKSKLTNDNSKHAFLAVHKFLDETGGENGGWSAIDHRTFLRIRQKYVGLRKPNQNDNQVTHPRNETAFFQDLVGLLAPKTLDDVEQHELWFQRYEELLLVKKQAIALWKKQKQSQENQSQDTERSTAEIHENEDGLSPEDWDKQKKQIEEKRKAVDLWRAEKTFEQFQQKMQQEEQERLEKEKKKRIEAEKRKEMKEQVEYYKQKKAEEDAAKLDSELRAKLQEEDEKRNNIQMNSARISERNTKMVEERIFNKHKRQHAQQLQQKRLQQLSARSQSEIKVKRDPARLLQPTAVWHNRVISAQSSSRASGDDGSLHPSHTAISAIQHRAVPLWRQNIN